MSGCFENLCFKSGNHDKILRVALRCLKESIHFRPLGFELLPDVFTMPQLQDLYESILDVNFDRRNFASKMLKMGILQEAGTRTEGTATRIPSGIPSTGKSMTK